MTTLVQSHAAIGPICARSRGRALIAMACIAVLVAAAGSISA